MHQLIETFARTFYIPAQVLRFLISGGCAAATHFGLLFVLTEFAHVWYLYSAAIGFCGGFFVSFTLQKFWTFAEMDIRRVKTQAPVYFLVALGNLGLNSLFVYALVEYAELWYMFAQVMVAALISIESFLVYKFLIFKASSVGQ